MEMVVLMPIFLLLIVGVLNFARLLWIDSMLDHAARKTIRYAMVHGGASSQPATTETLRAVFLSASPALKEERLQFAVEPDWSPAPTPGTAFRIEAEYSLNLWWDALPSPSVLLRADASSSVSQ